MKKRLAILLLMISVLMTVHVKALSKDETVYVKLKNDGTVKNISVTDHLINKEKSDSIIDYTDLENIENTNGKEKYTLNNNKITWKAKGHDIYYKGNISKEIPVSVNVTYKFNGKKTTVSKMLGKKGHVEINIKYNNNDKHIVNGQELYTPFVVATITVLNGSNVSNVVINTGKVVSNGQNYIVAGVSTPGLYESLDINELKDMDSLTISYDTKSFSLSSIYAVATSKIIDNIDLSRLENLNSLYNSIDMFDQSSKKLVDGTKLVNDGTTKINTGVSSAIDKLKNNKDTIDENSLNMIKEQASMTATEQIEAKKDEIMNQAIQSLIETEQATNQIKQASDYEIDNNASLIDALKLETYKQMNLTEEQVNQIKDACAAGMDDYCVQAQTIEAYENGAIEQAKQSFYENALELAKNITANTAYHTALDVASEVAGQTSEAVAQTVFDQVKITIIDKVVISLDELKRGLDTLNQGTKTLETGMTNFHNQGISKLTDLVNNKLKPNVSRVKDLRELAHQYNTFTKIGNDSKGNVKFIYTIDGVKVEEQKVKNKKAKKTSLWNRVTNLFK